LSMPSIPSVILLGRSSPVPSLIFEVCTEVPKESPLASLMLIVFSRTSRWYGLRRAVHRHWDCHSGYVHEPGCVHGWSVSPGLWSRDVGYGWPSICLGDCPSCLPRCYDGSIQCIVVRWWYPRNFYPMEN
jgi:hypothetical protein